MKGDIFEVLLIWKNNDGLIVIKIFMFMKNYYDVDVSYIINN